ncbi:MAG: phosphatase PAP2 family protein [Chitinophagales bacterium]|jgi:undecaprenyl-diphosphatase|nr:phosphatase PAP2 family protein [Chitinophagales bacterium]
MDKKINIPFIIYLMLVQWLIMGFLMLEYTQIEWIKYINSFQSDLWDVFFKLATRFGEIGVVILGLLWVILQRKSLIWPYVIGYIACISLSSVLKQAFSYPRPLSVIPSAHLTFIEGYPQFFHNSFPSGHAMSAYFMVYFFTFFAFPKAKSIHLLFFVLGLLTSLSRIYLLCHFPQDVYVSSLLAMFVIGLVYVLYHGNSGRIWKKK